VDEVSRAAATAGIPLGAFGLADDSIAYRVMTSDLSLLQAALADAA
jgi:hypothetical protein